VVAAYASVALIRLQPLTPSSTVRGGGVRVLGPVEGVEAVWADTPPPSARKSLPAHVVRLRHALGAAAVVKVGGGYRLDPEQVDVDSARVRSLVEQAREARGRGDADAAIALLGEAGAAFRGATRSCEPSHKGLSQRFHNLVSS
jgi:hypothetical protein